MKGFRVVGVVPLSLMIPLRSLAKPRWFTQERYWDRICGFFLQERPFGCHPEAFARAGVRFRVEG